MIYLLSLIGCMAIGDGTGSLIHSAPPAHSRSGKIAPDLEKRMNFETGSIRLLLRTNKRLNSVELDRLRALGAKVKKEFYRFPGQADS